MHARPLKQVSGCLGNTFTDLLSSCTKTTSRLWPSHPAFARRSRLRRCCSTKNQKRLHRDSTARDRDSTAREQRAIRGGKAKRRLDGEEERWRGAGWRVVRAGSSRNFGTGNLHARATWPAAWRAIDARARQGSFIENEERVAGGKAERWPARVRAHLARSSNLSRRQRRCSARSILRTSRLVNVVESERRAQQPGARGGRGAGRGGE